MNRLSFVYRPRQARLRIAGTAFSLAMLAGCASIAPPSHLRSPVLTATQREQVLAGLRDWSAGGEASLVSPSGSHAFSFRWIQTSGHEKISIYGPLGHTVARLSYDGHHAILVTASRPPQEARDPGILLRRILGVSLPVRVFPNWMLGLRGSSETVKKDAHGLPLRLQSGAWDVAYLNYGQVGGLKMPRLLEASGPGGLRLRLAITHWRLGGGS